MRRDQSERIANVPWSGMPFKAGKALVSAVNRLRLTSAGARTAARFPAALAAQHMFDRSDRLPTSDRATAPDQRQPSGLQRDTTG